MTGTGSLASAGAVSMQRAREAPRHAGRPRARLLWAGAASLALLSGCADLDLDLRDLGNGFDTSDAALSATAARPAPDDRGIISYPGYQVAVARRGDTVTDVAERIGLPAEELARFNGAPANAVLNNGEVLALPRRVSEPSPATGAATTGPIRPAGEVDVATLAGDAIDRAEGTQTIERSGAARSSGEQPIRHQVAAGDTAFSIARRYDVPLAALAEWNGLDREFTVRTGQYLLIPPAAAQVASAPPPAATTAPGTGSPTPTPPSAAQPLPPDTPSVASAGGGTESSAAAAQDLPASPNLGQERTQASVGEGRFLLPVDAPIVADFEAGEREGIAFSAAPGDTVRAAGAGRVRYISEDTVEGDAGEARVVLIAHEDGLNTVYVNVRNLAVGQGGRVTQGETFAEIGDAEPQVFQFQVRDGNAAVDPNDYIQ